MSNDDGGHEPSEQPAADTSGGRDLVPLEDAARRLGVSADALRKRLERGKTARGVKLNRQWFMYVADMPADTGHVQTADAAEAQRPPDSAPDTSAVSSSAVITMQQQLAAIRDEWLAPLIAENGDLREKIGRLEAEIERLQDERRQPAAAADAPRRQSLPPESAPAEQPPATGEQPEQPRRPWWQVWRS